MTLTLGDLRQLRIFAEQLVRQGGAEALASQTQLKIVKQKIRSDIVTNADLSVEQHLIEKIRQSYPGHAVVAEESGGELHDDIPTWVIDPIDGTKEYFRHVPLYACVASLQHQGQVLVAAVHNPVTGELFSAASGHGAFLNGQAIHVSNAEKLKDSVIMVILSQPGHDRDLDQKLQALKRLIGKAYRIRPYSHQNLALCWMALGAYDGIVSFHDATKLWDVSAGMLIAIEAGVKMRSWDRQSWTLSSLNQPYFGSGSGILNELQQAVTDQ